MIAGRPQMLLAQLPRLSLGAAALAVLLLASTFTSPRQAEAAVENLSGCTTNSLGPGDDSNPQTTPLAFTPNFFGQTYNQISVNNNGNVTFDGTLTAFTPENLLQTDRVIIAPFWADVDTRGDGSGVVTYGNVEFGDRPAFCVNWLNVGYYASHTDKTNSFQLLLVDRSDVGAGDFDIIINYDQVQWETGDFNGGSGGLGGNSARMGFSNGVDQAFEYPGSGVNGAFLDSSPTGLARNSLNSTVIGRYIFTVRGGEPPGSGSITGTVFGPAPNARAGTAGSLVPMANASVTACATPPCSSTTTNDVGQFTVAGLDPGDYHVIAYPPAGRDDLLPVDGRTNVDMGQSSVGQLNMSVPESPPAGTMIESIGNVGGAPVLDWSRTVDFSVAGCEGGSGTWALTDSAGNTLASGAFTEGPAGQYNASIPPTSPYHGPASISVSIVCPNPADNLDYDFSVYIDPSGVVLDLQGNPVVGASVTLLRSDSSSGPFDAVNQGSNIMSPSNRVNADFTDELGGFHWDTIAGYYIVRAEKAGCHKPGEPLVPTNQTPVLPVPPPQLDLVIRLNCGGGTGASEEIWGDADCSGGINPIDSLKILRADAGADLASVLGACPPLGVLASINTVPRLWGDFDCSLFFNPVDSLKTLRYDAGLSVPKNDPTCPDWGDVVTVGSF